MKTAGNILSPLLVIAASLTISSAANAWDKVAHMVVAQVAYDRLTPAARAEADRLIALLPADANVTVIEDKYKPYNFITASAWMDDMRKEVRTFNTWHYDDLPIADGQAVTPAEVRSHKEAADGTNAYEVITTRCLPTLKSKTATDADKARMLAFLLHLAGDIHQPLHAAGREKGGNGIAITPLPSADPDWKTDNLHAFWDNAYRYSGSGGKVALINPLPDLPRDGYQPDNGLIKLIADDMTKRFPADKAGKPADLDPADWLAESGTIAATFAFPSATPTLSPEYVQRAHDIACGRLVLAGYRLGAVLNSALSK